MNKKNGNEDNLLLIASTLLTACNLASASKLEIERMMDGNRNLK